MDHQSRITSVPIKENGDLQARYEALQRAYRCLEEKEQLRQDLANATIHDLKAPLSIILFSLGLFQTTHHQPLSPDQEKILGVVRQSGEEMLHLVTNLLGVQRLEADQIPVHLQPVDVARVLRGTVRQVRYLVGRNEVHLDLSLPELLPWVWADAHLTSRVVMNLVDNAIQNTPCQGRVTISGRAGAREMTISVADNGPGIPTADRERIFEKFAQVEGNALNGPGSVGLGLAFCQMAVQVQRGRIWVQDAPNGGSSAAGSLFRFTLPLWAKA